MTNSAADDPTNLVVYGLAFYLTTLGIIYVQEAERRIPINYSGRCVCLRVYVCVCVRVSVFVCSALSPYNNAIIIIHTQVLNEQPEPPTTSFLAE